MKKWVVLIAILLGIVACQSKEKEQGAKDSSTQLVKGQTLSLPTVNDQMTLPDKVPLSLADTVNVADSSVAANLQNTATDAMSHMLSAEQRAAIATQAKQIAANSTSMQDAMAAALGVSHTVNQPMEDDSMANKQDDAHDDDQSDDQYDDLDDDNGGTDTNGGDDYDVDGMGDVNPYSIMMQNHPKAADKVAKTQTQLKQRRQQSNDSPHPDSPKASAPQDSTMPKRAAVRSVVKQHDPRPAAGTVRREHKPSQPSYYGDDFGFDDLPVPVSIGGRPVASGNTTAVSSSQDASQPKARLQQLINQYDKTQEDEADSGS